MSDDSDENANDSSDVDRVVDAAGDVGDASKLSEVANSRAQHETDFHISCRPSWIVDIYKWCAN